MLSRLFKRPPAGLPADGSPQTPPAEELIKLYVQEYCLHRRICLKKLIHMLEREIIYLVLEEAHGNQRTAAKLLGLRPNTLHYKIQRMGLVPVHKYMMIEDVPGSREIGQPGSSARPERPAH
jgi:DNA-binding NtrC family response regulator